MDEADVLMNSSPYTAYVGTTDQILSAKTVTQDDTDDEGVFDDTANVTFSALAISGVDTIAGFLVYKFVVDDTDSIPLAWYLIDPDITPNGSDIVIIWNAEGIWNIT